MGIEGQVHSRQRDKHNFMTATRNGCCGSKGKGAMVCPGSGAGVRCENVRERAKLCAVFLKARAFFPADLPSVGGKLRKPQAGRRR